MNRGYLIALRIRSPLGSKSAVVNGVQANGVPAIFTCMLAAAFESLSNAISGGR
ncbi:MAG: hypothetical protein ISN28_14035 [Ectothiorhodospiraceae bacterium AqS1]|nr:hypothetical protein [Ectothiorhodospiraceae bacterium AqS1]MBF2761355.1 hypothetical protein [Ectothiorhodospiraceae bacterium AqS1]